MSVEKHARRALWRMVFWRLVGELFVLPQVLIRAAVAALSILGSWFKNLELAVFYLELDASRRYKLITGLDLGTASGEPGRYGSLDPHRAEGIQSVYMQHMTGLEDGGEE